MLGYLILLSVDQVTEINTSVTEQNIKDLPYTPYLYIHKVQKDTKTILNKETSCFVACQLSLKMLVSIGQWALIKLAGNTKAEKFFLMHSHEDYAHAKPVADKKTAMVLWIQL